MWQTTIVGHLMPEEMKARMLASDRRWQFQLWQVIYLMSSKGFRAKQTAEVVGVAKRTVYLEKQM